MTTLPDAIATARRAKGLTQEELGEAAGLKQGSVSRYESGARVPQPDALADLADVLGVTVGFLEGVNKVKGAWAIDAHMRRHATARATVWRRLEARLNMLRNHTRYLYEEIDILTDQVVPSFDPFYVEPEDAARMTRMQWHVPIGPVRSVVAWIEAAGCLIVEEDFGTHRVDGLSQWVDDHPVILLNVARTTDQKRLTLVHELGHLCLHTPNIGEDLEREADRFAAEFLMPAEVVRSQLRSVSLGRLLDLKRVWGVSVQALVERGYELKVISRDQRTSLHKQISARGWRKREPGSTELAPEMPELALLIGSSLQRRGLAASEIDTLAGFKPGAGDNPFAPSQHPHLRSIT